MRQIVLAVILTCLAITSLANAQVYYATLVGTVRDASGATVPNATITATELTTGVVTSATSNESGDYRIATLRPGSYNISATKASFKAVTINDIQLLVGKTTRVDIGLEVGEVQEKITVEGAAPLVQTDTAERGAIMGRREVEALPLNTRNITELTYLIPGAVKSSTQGEPVPDVNALGPNRNQYYVDGGGSTSMYAGQPVERVSIDTVQEFKVETALMTADRGLHAGSVISVATRQGTNQFHGVAYEFFRNNVLNARNVFASTPPSLRYNQFGATLGGPLIKNQLFFLANYEGSRERRARTFNVTMPTPAEKQGDFTPGTGVKNAAIFDPLSVDPTTGLRDPFPGNRIPESRIHPISRRYLSLWPDPQTSGIPNYIFNAPSENDFDRFAVRIDYNLREKDRFLFRYGHQNNPILNPGSVPGAATGTTGDVASGNAMVAGWNHMFGPRTLNEVRVSFAKNDIGSVPTDFYGQNKTKEFGFSNGDRVPEELWSLPSVAFGGVPTTGVGGGSVSLYPNQTYYVQDDLTFVKGRHTFKTGAQFVRFTTQGFFASAGGVLQSFSGLYTTQIGNLAGGQPFADFLLGALGGMSIVESAEAAYYDRHFWQMYFMDDWKVSSRLVLQLGLRYDINLPATSANGESLAWIDGLDKREGQVAVFPKNAEQPLKDALRGEPLGFPYRFSDNNWLNRPNWKDFQPRIGVAYRPFNDNRTVIRGGYGLFYDANINTATTSLNFGRPFYVFSATPARPVVFEPPPYEFGQVPILSAGFQPGEQFRSGYVSQPDWPDPRIQQWNVTFQRELGRSIAVEAAYVGNHLQNGQTSAVWNRRYPVGYTFRYDDGNTFTVTSDTPLLQRVKYPLLNRGTSALSWTHQTYHSAQFYVTKEMSHGVQFRAGYTTMGIRGTDGNWQDEWNVRDMNYTLSSERPNNFFATYVWDLPGQSLRGWAGALFGGWRSSGIINVVSGSRTFVNEGIVLTAGKSGFEVMPIMLRDPNLSSSERSLDRWFDTDAFVQTPANEFGTQEAVWSVRGDGLQNVDVAFSKIFQLPREHRLQFRAEFFNFFNHPQFGAPATVRGLATFGKVTSSGPAREVQFGLKYEF